MLITGVFWGTWFSLSRSIESIDPATFLVIGKTIIKNLAVPMAILMPVTILLILIILFIIKRKRSKEFYFTLVCLLLLITAMLITVLVEVPIDNKIKMWTIQTLPGNWKVLRHRWEVFHTIRTFLSIASFCFLILASFNSRKI